MKKIFLMIAMLSFAALTAQAGDVKPYSMESLKAAQKEGKTVVLDFHASWCPTCRKQDVVLRELVKEPELAHVQVLTVDYDKEKDLKAAHKVSKQSTLVVLKDGKESARVTGTTDKGEIKALLTKGM